MVRLSICIPTYNFGRFIAETLNSILPQLTPEVELVVLDGGSTDDTPTVVQQMFANATNLAYHRQDQRGGIDRDIERAVTLAKGDYCWLFSADDVMLPGAVADVLAALHSNSDVYLCEHNLCDLDLRVIADYPIFKTLDRPRRFDFSDAVQRQEYLAQARNSEAFFSFLAGPIFRKSVWDQAPVPESFRGTCWIVAGHLLWGLKGGMSVEYLARCLLKKRGDNDSFADRGLVNRCRIAIEGFRHIADNIFGPQSEEAYHIRRVVRTEISIRLLLRLKLKTKVFPDLESRELLDRIVEIHYADPGGTNALKKAIYCYTPLFLVEWLIAFKKLVRSLGFA